MPRQSLVAAILRSLPLRRPSVLSVQRLRTLAQATDGITAKVFSMLNELAVEAVKSGKEQISDEDMESWKPALEREAVLPDGAEFLVSIGTGLGSSPN